VENSVNRNECVDLSGLPIDDPIGLYFTEMSSVPLLTYEEEEELAKRMERGREVRQRLSRNGHDSSPTRSGHGHHWNQVQSLCISWLGKGDSCRSHRGTYCLCLAYRSFVRSLPCATLASEPS
jgi:hypothetical protein